MSVCSPTPPVVALAASVRLGYAIQALGTVMAIRPTGAEPMLRAVPLTVEPVGTDVDRVSVPMEHVHRKRHWNRLRRAGVALFRRPLDLSLTERKDEFHATVVP